MVRDAWARSSCAISSSTIVREGAAYLDVDLALSSQGDRALKVSQRALLLRVARRAMLDRRFEPDFPPDALVEAKELESPTATSSPDLRDLRALPWCSIDNDDSRDLDQLSVGEALPGGGAKIFVAIADVSASVAPAAALDRHARTNTTSVYTPPGNFPMFPDRLSTDLTSLVPGEDRRAVVVEMALDPAGRVGATQVYPAAVHNHAKLAYPGVGAWLEAAPAPPALAPLPALAENLRLQDRVAQRLRTLRQEAGALELETVEVRAQFDGDTVSHLVAEKRNRARELIEEFMIAANGVIARFLEAHRFPVIRRVVRSPERWERIAEIALAQGVALPSEPDARALTEFLLERRSKDPLRFPDLSLSIIKLLGRGEYVASFPGQAPTGHFGLAVSEYTHSTAPNRRYPDLLTQRLIHAALVAREVPYARGELVALADHFTRKEDDAQKVERLVRKAAAACLLSAFVGQEFDGIVTGASAKGTWVRIFEPPAEGRLEQGEAGLDVGDRVRVKLVHTDPERGFIDFVRSKRP